MVSQALRSLLLVTLFQTVRKPMTCPYWSVSWLQLWHTPWRLSLASKCQSPVEAASYQVPEKKFWTCVKGVKYESGSQKARQSGVITPKLSKHSRKEDKESNSETQSSQQWRRRRWWKEHFHKSATITKKMEMWQKTVKSGQWHAYQISPKSTSWTPSPSRPFTPPFPDC